MTDTRWMKVWRDLWRHRGRSLTTICAVSAGLLGAGIVLDAWSLVNAATHTGYDATNPPAATLRLAPGSEDRMATVVEEVRTVPGVSAVHVRRTAFSRVRIHGVARTAMLFGSDDLATQVIGRVEHEQGLWPLHGANVAVDYSVLDFAGVSLGDSITFDRSDRPLSLPISTVVRDAGLPPGWMDHVVYVFVTDSVIRQLVPQAVTELRFTAVTDIATREDIQRLSRTITDRLSARGISVTHTEVPEPGVHVHAGQIESFLFIQGAFGVVALLFSAVLIVNLVSATLIAQRPLIGVMKTTGATPRQLRRMYLTHAIVIGAVSAIVALPLAAVIGRAYAAFVAALLNFTVEGYGIPWYLFAGQAATALLLPAAAAWVPVRRACTMSVAEALRPSATLTAIPSLTWLPARLRAFPAVPFVVRNLWRHQRRVLFTVTALSIGGAVFLGALQLRRSIQRSTAVLYEQTLRADAMLRTEHPVSVTTIESRARGVQGVQRAEGWSTLRAAIVADGRVENRFTITAPSATTALLDLRPTQGRWLRGDDSTALVVSRELAEAEPSLSLGSWTTLLIHGATRRWQVVGVAAIPGRVAYASQHFVMSSLGISGASALAVQFSARDTATHLAIMNRVRTALEADGMTVSGAQRLTEARAAAEDHLVMVVDFLIAAAQLTLIVAALGLASTMGLSVLERTREIGVMRAVGASPRAIMAVVQGEGLLIAGASALLAVPLSVPMSVILGAAFGRMMFPVPVLLVPAGSSVLLCVVVSLVAASLACAAPARRATRIGARDALSHD